MRVDEPQSSTTVCAHGCAAVASDTPLGGHPFQRPTLAHELLLQRGVLEHGDRIIIVVLMTEEFGGPVDIQRPTVHYDTY